MRINVGDRVRHWFAGRGIVLAIEGRLARVQWATGGSGLAFIAELGVIKRAADSADPQRKEEP